MKIYIASSWKNTDLVYGIAKYLRGVGFDVDAFMDDSKGRYVFHWSEILNEPDKSKSKLNAITFLEDNRTQRAFKEDKKWLNWCDCCLLVLPAGNSSHLEAGYAKGQGKQFIIYSPSGFAAGEFDVMYGFADLMTDSIEEIIEYLKGAPK